MKPYTAYNPSRNTAILIVGDPGTGKTRLIFSPPTPGILDCDGNLNSAVRVANGKPFFFSEGFRTDEGIEIPEEQRWDHCGREVIKLLKSPEVKTIVIDGLSNLCRWGLIHIEAELVKAGINVHREFYAKYQSFIPLLSKFITTIRIPGKLVMVTCHQRTDKDEFGRMRYYLDIPGRLSETLGGQFTDVWGMSSTPDPTNEKTQTRYEIRTKPSGYHINLKTSFDFVPAINITDKTPQQMWSIFEPILYANVNSKTN